MLFAFVGDRVASFGIEKRLDLAALRIDAVNFVAGAFDLYLPHVDPGRLGLLLDDVLAQPLVLGSLGAVLAFLGAGNSDQAECYEKGSKHSLVHGWSPLAPGASLLVWSGSHI